MRYRCNWRSFTGIRRKSNARTLRPPAWRQLAFLYRDMAEKERQFAEARPTPRDSALLPGCARGCSGVPFFQNFASGTKF